MLKIKYFIAFLYLIINLNLKSECNYNVSPILDPMIKDQILRTKIHKDELCIHIEEGKNVEIDMGLLTEKVNNCLRSVFFKSPIDLTLNLYCKKSSREIPADWEDTLKFSINDPLLTLSGKNLPYNKLGSKSEDFILFISSKVERSSAKKYWPKVIPLQERLDAIKVANMYRMSDQFYKEVLDPFQKSPNNTYVGSNEHDKYKAHFKKLSNKYSSLLNSAIELEKKISDRQLPMGRIAMIRPQSENELANIIVHELMHLYGGLVDRYKGKPLSRHKWENNLMGKNAKCNPLTRDQIKSILRYRLDGTAEKEFEDLSFLDRAN